MSYDPFSRGPHPVGVITFRSQDPARKRDLPLEIWYPATAAHRGQDLAEASQANYQPMPMAPPSLQAAVRDAEALAGPHPVVAFSHGFAGHRCQSTFLCTHLASHGYLVVAPDHVGNTTLDVMTQAMKLYQEGGGMPGHEDMLEPIQEIAALRPGDVGQALDAVLKTGAPGAPEADASRVGVSGHSFGGWTTLMTAGADERIRAAVPLAPAGGSTDLPVDPFADSMQLDWNREVPTLYIVSDRDSVLPLRGMHELYEKTREPRRMVVLENADHQHFCDNAEQIHELMRAMPMPGLSAGDVAFGKDMAPFSELTPAEAAADAVRGLTLAHFDAVLGERAEAGDWLAEAVARLADRGVDVSAH